MIVSWIFGMVVQCCTFGGLLVGFAAQKLIPESHRTIETRKVMKLGIGLIGTLGAFVLGLMISAASISYDRQRQEIIDLSARVVMLDRALAGYGPETQPLRRELRGIVKRAADRIWPESRTAPVMIEPVLSAEAWLESVHSLVPATDAQRFLRDRAVALATEVMGTRWLLYHQSVTTISAPMLFMITSWFVLIFVCIGLMAPRNSTVVGMLFVCALSVTGAMMLALDLDRPFEGVLRISSEPVQRALDQLGK
jgi:hypothetical protein